MLWKTAPTRAGHNVNRQLKSAIALAEWVSQILQKGEWAETRKLGQAIAGCASRGRVVGTHIETDHACHSPLCPTCALDKQRRLYRRLLDVEGWLSRNHPEIQATFLTLSIKTVPGIENFESHLKSFKRDARRFLASLDLRGCLRIVDVKAREHQGLGFHGHAVVLTDRHSPTTALLRNEGSMSVSWRKSCHLDYVPQAAALVINLRKPRRLAGLGYYMRKSTENDSSSKRRRMTCTDPDHLAAVALLFKKSTRMTATGLMKEALAACDADYKTSRGKPSLPPAGDRSNLDSRGENQRTASSRTKHGGRAVAKRAAARRMDACLTRQRPSSTTVKLIDSPRPFLCARCFDQVVIGRRNRYCGKTCASAARRDNQRASNKRYQATAGGRQRHNQRQARYRTRRRTDDCGAGGSDGAG